jgi:hypothetical protein
MNRRSFLRSAGLIAGSAFIALNTNALGLIDPATLIKGRVSSRKKGIRNVVISDGFTVVLTDKNGNYELKPNEKAKSVFMSTPAGYQFKNDYNIAKQYEKLDGATQYDFSLEPLQADDKNHHFIIWADPQVKNKKDVQQMLDTSVPDTIATIKSLGKNALVHGICVGDMVWDNHSLFPEYNKAIDQLGIPFFQVLGNHDMDYRMGGDETSDSTFKNFYGPTYYSFNRGQAHYIVLDDVRYLGTERNYDGYITEEQLAWLAKDLEHVAKDKLIIINLHIPVYLGVKNNAAFYEVLQQFRNVHVMSGHTHFHENNFSNGVYEHNHGTVCGAWWTGPICTDGTPRGYGVYEVNGTELKGYYKSTGLPKEHQLSLHVQKQENGVRLVANIWNYDPQWKVTYFLDGNPAGELTRESGFDPLSVELYQGENKPEGRHFVEPHETGHLFSATIGRAVQKVKVLATDRLGNQYQNEISVN